MFLMFNEEVRKILLGAKKEMNSLKHLYVGTEHLLLSILKCDNFVTELFKEYNVTYEVFKDKVINKLGKGVNDNKWFVYTPLLKKIIENSIIISKDKNFKEVNLNIIMLSLLEEGDGVAYRILGELGVDFDLLYDELNICKIQKKNKQKMIIDDLGINFNKRVLNDDIDPVVGRDKEVARLIEILCRRTKNNPLLIGEAGVGKTSIVEELSRRIVNGDVPLKLLNKRVISISMANLVSGTKYRGEFEDRVTKLLKEVEECNDIIIFIDEIHTLVGAGGAEGAIDASNILKPALARGKINIIGATTTSEYKKYIEDDKALSRRFQNIVIKEPNDEVVLDILYKLRPIYEDYHNVIISDELLNLIIELSNRFLYGRKQPDKAIDILDEVCSRTSIIPSEFHLKELHYKSLLKKVSTLKNEAIFCNKFDDAIRFKEEEYKIESYLNKLNINNKHILKNEIDKNCLIDVVSENSKIPISNILKSNDYVNDVKAKLKKIIVGQDLVIENFVTSICNHFNFFKNEMPLSFLLVGSSGVGKTLLAREIGKILFSEDNIIKVDMSQYREEHSISKIIGAPPGYVGYNNKNGLLEDIKDNPYSLLILENIEKAHPSVLNLFLQILEEGKVKDSTGNSFRFGNVLIIMTTSVGCDNYSLGFEEAELLNVDLTKYFNDEFLNRIGKILFFNKLSSNDIKNIVNLKISNVDDSFVEFILKESDYKNIGARKIDKIISDNYDKYVKESKMCIN